MSLYKAPSTTPRDRSLLGQILAHIRLLHYQYEVTFSPYVMTPGEKFVLNTIVILVLSLLAMGIVCYLPPLLMRAGSRFFWLYNGRGDELIVNITVSMWNEMAHDRLQFHRYCVTFPVYGLHPFEIYILHRLALLSTLLILGTAFWVFRLGSMLRWHCGTFIYKAHKVTNDRHILQDRESGMEDLNQGMGFCCQADVHTLGHRHLERISNKQDSRTIETY
ncbi:uncharacterized protein PAC_18157 [Phialocephala subalpina]|uniref:Uncharacterized protein n=1 Tax=Phialocephala subalpina TaxID=576137 RepID=A0A1L7XTF4_9HELO|nr:uncharacterized protein PAC_18157 [Phialocephala subalpina]